MDNENKNGGDKGTKGNLQAFELAVTHFGGVAQMADAIQCSQPHISAIRNNRRSISLDLAISIQVASQDTILASDLRPDKKEELERAR